MLGCYTLAIGSSRVIRKNLDKLKLHLFDLLLICCGFVVQLFDSLYSFSTCCGLVESHTPLFRFFVDLFSIPQQIHNILTCRDVVDLSKSCGFVVQLVVYNKSTTNRTSGV
jgi:hypothetical protein